MYHFEINTNRKELNKAQTALEIAQKNYDDLVEKMKYSTPRVSGRSIIKCKKCGEKSSIKDINYSEWYWFENPHGCTDGDTWHFGGFLIECPHCKFVEQVHKPSDKYGSSIEISEYKILERMLKFAHRCDDAHTKNCKWIDLKPENRW